MAISPLTLRLAGDLRVTVAGMVDAETRALVRAWARAWDEIRSELDEALQELVDLSGDRWATRTQIARATRAQRALAVAGEHLNRLTQDAGVAITDTAGRAVNLGARAQPRIITSQLPPAYADKAIIAARFDRVSADALDAIVRRTTGQVESALNPLAEAAAESMRRALVRGVAVGDNPREAARRMLRLLEGEFNGGLTRALNIARTEILDAHRLGAAAQHSANGDILSGWVWHSEMSRRTCPSCWSRHGEQHPLSEPGPLDHQSGRCSRTPVAKTWRELGFTLSEPPSALPDARTAFDALPQADQLRVMGPARLAGLRDGSVSWADLSQRRPSRAWRTSYGVRPVRDLTSA